MATWPAAPDPEDGGVNKRGQIPSSERFLFYGGGGGGGGGDTGNPKNQNQKTELGQKSRVSPVDKDKAGEGTGNAEC